MPGRGAKSLNIFGSQQDFDNRIALLHRVGKLGGVLSAGFGQFGFPSARTPDDGSYFLDNSAGRHPGSDVGELP